ncbi:hypothetical protein OIU78_008879 [Salix suchowensis]|nr:hypothetical protein OIU78_008879 [Salix suchowensis]
MDSPSLKCASKRSLHIITSYPPQEISKEASLNGEILEFEENRGIDIDLNMGLSPAWSEANDHENHSPESSSLLSASSFVEKGLKNDSSMEVLTADKSSSEGECCLKVVGDQFGRDSPTIQATGEEPQRWPRSKKKKRRKNQSKWSHATEKRTKTNKDCLDLLIEAAGMVSGNSEDKESDSDKHEETKRSRKCSLVVDLYEDNTSSPAVRSKRRRSQVLPHRYRDSSVLLEPWKRMPKPQKAETTAATAVSKKRKSG